MLKLKTDKSFFFLLLILIIATFFRFWKLDSLPPTLWPDEAINANTAVNILESKTFQVFYPDNQGREGLFFLLVSLAFSLFGISLWSFKLVSALAGVLTIFGQYLLSLELFRKKPLALLSSFFLAISFWHINFSRIGFRAILLPLVLVYSFYFFFRGLRQKKLPYFIFSGIIFGLGFYTYTTFRLAVIPLFFLLFSELFNARKEKWQSKYLIFSAVFLLSIFITALPIGLYFLKNPECFVSRVLNISVFDQANPLKEFIKSLGIHLSMFNFVGDFNLRHNLPGFPQLFPLVGFCFLTGLFQGVKRIIYCFKNKKEEVNLFLFLFIWFFSLLLPSALTIEGIPHSLRTIGVIPVVYLFAGLGAYFFYEKFKNKFLTKIFLPLILIGMTLFSFFVYFKVWASNPKLEDAFTARYTDLGEEINSLPSEVKKYVIENEGELPSEVVRFVLRTKEEKSETIFLKLEEIETVNFSSGDYVFIMNKEVDSLKTIKENYPNSLLYEKERILFYKIKE